MKLPYGSWPSTITAEYIAGKENNLSNHLQVDGENIYFLENRPGENGRTVLMRIDSYGEIHEELPTEFNVRTKYLEYGGRCFHVFNGDIYFVNYSDQNIYKKMKDGSITKVTNVENNRFADFVLDSIHNRLISLREILAKPEPINSICSIELDSGEIKNLISGEDFYHCPKLDIDQKKILWISWNHPNMAWNGTELWAASFDESGKIKNKEKIAGDKSHGVCQAKWGTDNQIYFIAEFDQWFNLYSWNKGKITNMFCKQAEFASPDWNPGVQQYALNDEKICSAYTENGMWRLCLISLAKNKEIEILPMMYSTIEEVHTYKKGFIFLAGMPTKSLTIFYLSEKENEVKELYCPQKQVPLEEEISRAQTFLFDTEDGVGHAWFYPPKNKNYVGMDEEKPPLIVKCHGGPTSFSSCSYSKLIQFWTSRGHAVIDVNYGGSTGFGRKYRERLRQKWGIVDVGDCVKVVAKLSKDGLIDPKRVAIRGGSAGGYTTLAALTFTKGIFQIGASYYGISELEILAKDTHKLESRYMDQLVGPYPESINLYKQRSPIEFVKNLNCPIIFFQGEDDLVVPPNQSSLIYESLKQKDIYTEFHLYSEEGHGFRMAKNIIHSLKAELNFYAKFFHFKVQKQDEI